MKQVWHPYWDWEDYKAGMWRKLDKHEENRLLKIAKEFTSDWILYSQSMHRVVFEWPITMEHNLTNPSINQKAFVGHCAVCIEFGIPEYITRLAWKELTEKQKELANNAAQKAIDKWSGWYLSKDRRQLCLFK